MSGKTQVERGSVGEPGDPYETVCATVITSNFIAVAETAQIVWGKIGSYPFWPAQVLSSSTVAARPDLLSSKPKALAVPVMFFGEYTYGWLTRKNVLTWGEGISRGCHTKINRQLRGGVEEVAAFLALDGRERLPPPSWWCAPPTVGAESLMTQTLESYFSTTDVSEKAVRKAPPAAAAAAAAVIKAVATLKPAAAADGLAGGSEKVRWSARDVLKPLVNRLKRLFPQLIDEPTPSTTQDLFEWVKGYFGNAIDIENNLKGKTPADLLAEMFTRQTGRIFSGDQVASCFQASQLDSMALKALDVNPSSWDVPLVGGPPKKIQLQTRRPVPSSVRVPKVQQQKFASLPAAEAPSVAVDAAPAVLNTRSGSMGSAFLQTDPEAVSMRISNGKLILPSTKSRAIAVAAATGSKLNEPPDYVHVRQNVWVSRMRPKRLHKDEISVCNCPRPKKSAATVAMVPEPPAAQPVEATAEAAVVDAVDEVAADAVAMELDGPMVDTVVAEITEENIKGEGRYQEPEAVVIDNLKSEEEQQPQQQQQQEEEGGAVDQSDEAIVRRIVAEIFAPYFDALLAPEAATIPGFAPTAAPAVVAITTARQPSARAGSRTGIPTVDEAAPAAPRGPGRPPSSAADASGLCIPRDGCGEGCLNRLSFIHCDKATCPSGDRCSNRPFYQLECPSMEVFLTRDKGWGVRSKEFIPRGRYVVEYAGEVVDENEMRARMEAAKQRQEPHFYMMEMAPGLIIDARPKGNIARLLNSSCDPNCETQKWHDAATGEVRVGIFTLRDVAPGEELVYDYHFQQLFGQENGDEGEYSCRCGAAKCRGTMDATLDRATDCGRRIEIWWTDDKVYYAGTVTSYSSTTGKHTILYDDGETEKLDLQQQTYRWLDEECKGAVPSVVAPAPVAPIPAIAAVMGDAFMAQQQQQQQEQQQLQQAVVVATATAANAAPVVARRGRGRPPGSKKLQQLVQQQQQEQPKQQVPHISRVLSEYRLPQELLAVVQELLPEGAGPVAPMPVPALCAALEPSLAAAQAQVNAVAATLAAAQAMDIDSPVAAAEEDSIKEVVVNLHVLEESCSVVVEIKVSCNLKSASPPSPPLPPPVGAPAAVIPVAVAAVKKGHDAALQTQVLPPNGQLLSSPPKISQESRLLASLRRELAGLDSTTAAVERCAALQERLGALRKFLDSQILGSDEKSMVVIDNPGAQAVAGRLHGNGKGGAPGRARRPSGGGSGLSPSQMPTTVSGRGRKRQRKMFGDDYLEEEHHSDIEVPKAVPLLQQQHQQMAQAQAESVKREHQVEEQVRIEELAPARQSRTRRGAVAVPGPVEADPEEVQAVALAEPVAERKRRGAVMVAAEEIKHAAGPAAGGVNGEPSTEKGAEAAVPAAEVKSEAQEEPGPPAPAPAAPYLAPPASAPANSGYRRSGPTAGSTGLPARTILVAKRLTNSDVSKGRILLPRAAVEANLSFAIGRAHSLTARDHLSQSWEFTLQSWANGMESRRVYVLEHAGDYIRHHALKLDDVIGISCTENGDFLVEYNTDEVCSAAETQQAARGQGTPAPPVQLPQGCPAPGGINPLIQHNSGRCTRSEYCNKPAGHPGFCMRTPGAAARGGRKGTHAPRPPLAQQQQQDGSIGGAGAVTLPAKRGPSAEDIRKWHKRARKPSQKATSTSYRLSTEEEDASYDDMDESDEDSDWAEEDRNRLAQIVSSGGGGGGGDKNNAHSHRRRHHGHGRFTEATPPPDMDPSVPPIFVMAPDVHAPPPMPPHLRSPLRPSILSRQASMPSAMSPGGPNTMQHAASMGSQGSLPLPLPPLPAPGAGGMGGGAGGIAVGPGSGCAAAAAGGGQQHMQQPGAVGMTSLPSVPELCLPAPMGVNTTAAAAVAQPAAEGGDDGSGRPSPAPVPTAAGGTATAAVSSYLMQHHQGMLPIPHLSVPLFGGPPPAHAPGVHVPENAAPAPHVSGGAGGGATTTAATASDADAGAATATMSGASADNAAPIIDFDCMSFLTGNNNNNPQTTTNMHNNNMGSE